MNLPKFTDRSTPWFFLLICAISYGVLAPLLGFYWDDWPSIWFLHIQGPAGFQDVFSVDRPLLGQLFRITTIFLTDSAPAWQIFAILTRLLSVISFWWMLKQVWPRRSLQVGVAAAFFAVYPGFTQGFIAVTYSHGFILQAAFWFSIGVMLWGLRNFRWFWPAMLVSVLASGWTLFTVEYYFGLELLRPILLWIVLSEDDTTPIRQRISRIGRIFAPYLLMIAAFLYWRFALHQTVRGSVRIFQRMGEEPVEYSLELVGEIAFDMLQSGLLAWLEPLNPSNFTNSGALVITVSFVITLLAGIIAAIYWLGRAGSTTAIDTSMNTGWAKQALVVGALSLGLGGWPFWTTNLPIALRFPWDRFTLALMFGASLLAAGLLEFTSRRRLVWAILLGALIGLSAGYHFRVANQYRLEWNSLKQFVWQLTWRAPSIEPGTLLMTSEQPYAHMTDNSLTAPINWIYANPRVEGEMEYLLYDLGSRLEVSLPDIHSGIEIEQVYRNLVFQGSTDRALVYYYTPPGCVKFMDPQYDRRLPQLPRYISDATGLSDIERILATAPDGTARPPEDIFGIQPAPDWCYYFEKAELARQNGDWQEVLELGEQALALGERLYPVNAPEFLPYIEAFLRSGEADEAYDLSLRAFHLSPRLNRSLCDTWDRAVAQGLPDPEAQEYYAQLAEICP